MPTWKGIRDAWSRFWFLPADPTTLGLMRIMTGCIVLYVHLAYTLELGEFFGPSAWMTQQTANRERLEQPVFVPPIGWQQQGTPPRLPDLPHRRTAVIEFLGRLADNPDQRIKELVFLSTLFQNHAERRPFFDAYAALTPDQRATLKQQITDKSAMTIMPLPDSFKQLSTDAALRNLHEADDLIPLLGPSPGAGYVLDWFRDLDTAERFKVLDFIRELPASTKERAKIVDYLDFWNTDPRLTYTQGKTVFSPWFHLQDSTSYRFVHAAVLIVIFLFTIGLWTRVTAVLTWLALLGYIHRAAPVMFGLDSVMSVAMLYLVIGPGGAALSIDRLRARFRAARALTEAAGKPVPWAEAVLAGPRPSSVANITLRLVQIHFCLIYASTGFTKVKGPTWWNHSAGWMSLVNPDFSLVHAQWFESLMHALAESRVVLALIMAGIVAFTIVLEVALPILIWTSLRPYLLIGSILLHSGIAFMMGLTPFGLIMMTLLLAFFPASVVRQAPAWMIRRGGPITLKFNPADAGQLRRANRLRALDVAGMVTLQPGTVKAMDEVDLWSLAILRQLRWLPGGRAIARMLLGV